MRYAVMLSCREGQRLGHDPLRWQYLYRTVTWCFEDTYEAAAETAKRLHEGSPRDVARAWVEERA